jgi:hypothetical protein
MTELQRKVKTLLMRVELLFDESIKQNVTFDEANEYGVLHEIIEVIRESNDARVVIKKPQLKVVSNDE